MVTGVATSLISSCSGLRINTGLMVGLFEVLQYVTFLLFLNTELPPHTERFMTALYENTVEIAEILKHLLEGWYEEDLNFTQNMNFEPPTKFKLVEAQYPILYNASVPILIQIIIVLTWSISKLIQIICRITNTEKGTVGTLVNKILSQVEYHYFLILDGDGSFMDFLFLNSRLLYLLA